MNNTDEKPDRRKRRTRALLRKALMELIVEKGFDAISVQDITDRADVSRATFYLHYADKEELLSKSMMEVYNELVEKAEVLQTLQRDEATAVMNGDHSIFYDATDFEHVAEHAEFYRVLLSEKGVASFNVMVRQYLASLVRDHFCAPLRGMGTQERMPADLVAHAVAGAQIGVISWWLENGQKHTPQEMAKMFYEMNAFGFWWAMGIDIPAPSTPFVPAAPG